ncbi:hypothetical protein C0583_01040 [Candidatus Parcubacteria bacterium]|nr:MAG: hypothetical protein C0583_01040 [Candidatus Parcubacteria bacterium]
MDLIKIKNQIKREELDKITKALLAEQVVVLPTDTVYGLHCLATSKKAVNKIYKIKERPKSIPLLVLVKSYCMLHDYFKINKKQEDYIRSIWPRTTREAHNFSKFSRSSTSENSEVKLLENSHPVSFILEDKGKLHIHLNKENQGVAVRLPQNILLINILKKVNIPIVSTSLNISGKKTLQNLKNIEKYFKVEPDLVVDAGILKGKSSKLVDIRDIKNVKTVRE